MLEKQMEKEDQLRQMTLKCQGLETKNKTLELQIKRLLKLIVSLKKGE
jgi:Arc/MetJ family transcription regulator